MILRIFRRFCVLLVPVSIFLVACVFHSDEEFVNPLTKPDPAAITGSINLIDLVNYDPGDTIELYGSTSFNIAISQQNARIESAMIYLDDRQINYVPTNFFTVGLTDLKTGVSVLRAEIVASSGTGSLADAVHAEKLKLSYEWIVKVDVTPPPKPAPIIDIVDGLLTLKWDKYSKPNFQSYSIKRRLPDGSSRNIEIKDKMIDSWKDSSYVGGTTGAVTYSLSLATEVATATSETLSRADPLVITHFSFDPSDSTFILKWKPTKFFGAFKEYQLGRESADHVIKSTNPADSVFADKLSTIRFGGNSFVGVSIRSNDEDFPEFWNWKTCNIGTPLPFTPVGKIAFNTHLNSFVALDADDNLVKLNDQLELVETIGTLRGARWQMPYPGNFAFSRSDNGNNNNIFRLNLDDNTEVHYDYDYLSYTNSYTVASSGLICIDYDRPPFNNPAPQPPLYIIGIRDPAVEYDPFTPFIFNESSNTVKLSAVISEDGQFIFANNNRVIRMSSGTPEPLGSLTPSGSFIGFRPDDGSEIMFKDGDKINFYNANTLTLSRSINTPSDVYWNDKLYDVQTKNMIWKYVASTTYFKTVNIETGATKKIQISSKISPSDLYMLGDLLICNGMYIKVKR